jgi:hypothetical protein
MNNRQSSLLTLYSTNGVIDLRDYVSESFIFSTSDATGFGIPDLSNQFFEGASDGSVFRGQRVLSREITLPIYIQAKDRDSLLEQMKKLELTLAKSAAPQTLIIGDVRSGKNKRIDVVLGSFTDYKFGSDTNSNTYLKCVLTLLAPNPYFESEDLEVIKPYGESVNKGLLSPYSLAELNVSASRIYTSCIVYNDGTQPAYPIWYVYGECREVAIENEFSERIYWKGSIAENEYLIIDTKKATIVDNNGNDRYLELLNLPRFFPIDSGYSVIKIFATNYIFQSNVIGYFRKRYLMVV